ncbi:MAG: hypothetical protein CHACPFDD_00072 [Phycisphaerae bacterium]|nr:hypothetical protein [Phycisphaerae bacterium]
MPIWPENLIAAAEQAPAPVLIAVLAALGLPLLWLIIIGTVARVSGWSSLSSQYRAAAPPGLKRWHGQSAELGRHCNYGGCLTFWADGRGFGIVPFLLFRFQHPALFIPWRDVRVRRWRGWIFEYVRLEVGRMPPIPITISPRLAARLSDAAGAAWPETAAAAGHAARAHR